jgi:hypothetical protein
MQKRVTLATLVMLTASYCQSQDMPEKFEFFPGDKIFPSFTADALTHQISLSHVTENRDWVGTIGGSIPVVQANLPDVTIEVSAAVSTFNRLISPPGLTVYTTDYKVDFPLDVRISDNAFRFGLGHYSCHFVDDGIELLGKHSIQYVKDYAMLAVARDISLIRGHVYVAAQWTYHNVPVRDKKWQLQLGCEAGNISLSRFVQLYCAIDTKLKQEVGWGSTQNYQIGARFFMKNVRALRIAYTIRRGFDERGQFFNNREDISLVSAFIDF